MGEIHSIAAFSSGGNALIITGRLLRSVKQYQAKKLAELRRAKRRMLQKTNARIRDLNHKITRSFVTWAIENKVAKVFIGNPEGVQRKKRRKIVSQKLSRWNFGKHLEYLTYKLAAVGISIEKNLGGIFDADLSFMRAASEVQQSELSMRLRLLDADKRAKVSADGVSRKQ